MRRSTHRTMTRFWRNQSGVVAVEFVLIAPLLFALLLGVISIGYFMGITHSVHQLAASAARVSVTGLNQEERASLTNTYLSEAGTRYPLLQQTSLTPLVTFDNSSPEGITVELTYSVEGSLLDLANGFLGLGITDIKGSAYLAY